MEAVLDAIIKEGYTVKRYINGNIDDEPAILIHAVKHDEDLFDNYQENGLERWILVSHEKWTTYLAPPIAYYFEKLFKGGSKSKKMSFGC